MRVIKFEIYRSFHSKSFLISILIGLVICMADLITFCMQFGIEGNKYLIQAWIGTDYQFAYNEMFYIMLPVIGCLPHGGSLYSDIKSGYDGNICTRTSRLSYSFAKCIAVFISAFVSVAIPLAINLFVGAGLFPNFIPERLEFLSIGLLDRHLFTLIYSFYPAIYCVIFIFIDGLFAGVIALTSLSISRWIKSYFAAVVSPMVIVVILSMILAGDDKGNWSIISMLNPRQYVTTFWYQMALTFVGILMINSVVIWIISRKRDVL